MATTKIWAVHSRLDHLVDYVANKGKTANLFFDDLRNVLEYSGDETKTEQKYFVSGLNCQPETAYPAMRQALRLSKKSIKVLGYHAYQSFAENEVTAEVAHEIGKKLAAELWGSKFQVVVATHCNTTHFHNHFVFCSTSFVDGSRYHHCKETQYKMREASDRLCREYGLSVIEHPQNGKTKHYAEWQADKLDKPTWRGIIRSDIDRAIAQSATDKQFFFRLREMGYQVKTGKDISVRPPGKERFFRLKRNLGEDYSLEAICRRILEQQSQCRLEPPPQKKTAHRRLKGLLKRNSIGGLRGLYLHYCYRLGIFPKKRNPSPARLHFLLREDLAKLDNIISEAKLLTRCHIDTGEQLLTFQAQTQTELSELSSRRAALKKTLRTAADEEKPALKASISVLSQRIAKLRKELTQCDSIAQRSGIMTEKLSTIKKEQTKQAQKYQSKKGRDFLV
jgi:Relaxase/Mobilisation nuclease domain.